MLGRRIKNYLVETSAFERVLLGVQCVVLFFSIYTFWCYGEISSQWPSDTRYIFLPDAISAGAASYRGVRGDFYAGYIGTIAQLIGTAVLITFWLVERSQNKGADKIGTLIRGLEFLLKREALVEDFRVNIGIALDQLDGKDDSFDKKYRLGEMSLALKREYLNELRGCMGMVREHEAKDLYVAISKIEALGATLPTAASRQEFTTYFDLAYSKAFREQLKRVYKTYEEMFQLQSVTEEQ